MKNRLLGTVLILLSMVGVSHAQVLVPDGDFSSPNLAAGTFTVAPSGTAWTYSTPYSDTETAPNEAGVAAAGVVVDGVTGPGGQNLNAPAGTQALFLQNVASVSQEITVPTSTVTLTFDLIGRPIGTYTNSLGNVVTSGYDEVVITLGGVTLYEGAPTSGTDSLSVTTSSAGFSAGTYDLTIAGVSSGNATPTTPATFKDTMSFVSNVDMIVVDTPEPSSTAMLVLGGLALGGLTLRRRFVR